MRCITDVKYTMDEIIQLKNKKFEETYEIFLKKFLLCKRIVSF